MTQFWYKLYPFILGSIEAANIVGRNGDNTTDVWESNVEIHR